MPGASSSLPERRFRPDQPARRAFCKAGRGRSYLALLRVGFAESRCRHRNWCALTAPFHPYRDGKDGGSAHRGGLLSVALSRALRPVGVADHPVLWSPDFPLLALEGTPHVGVGSRLRTKFFNWNDSNAIDSRPLSPFSQGAFSTAPAAAVRPAPKPLEPYRNGRQLDRRSIIPAGSQIFP